VEEIMNIIIQHPANNDNLDQCDDSTVETIAFIVAEDIPEDSFINELRSNSEFGAFAIKEEDDCNGTILTTLNVKTNNNMPDVLVGHVVTMNENIYDIESLLPLLTS